MWSTSSSFPDDEGLDLASGTICSQRIDLLILMPLEMGIRQIDLESCLIRSMLRLVFNNFEPPRIDPLASNEAIGMIDIGSCRSSRLLKMIRLGSFNAQDFHVEMESIGNDLLQKGEEHVVITVTPPRPHRSVFNMEDPITAQRFSEAWHRSPRTT